MSSERSSTELAYQSVALPGRVRRWLLLLMALPLGGLLAQAIPRGNATVGDVLPLILLAILAGVSGLWSP
jgi:hypothetical protein